MPACLDTASWALVTAAFQLAEGCAFLRVVLGAGRDEFEQQILDLYPR